MNEHLFPLDAVCYCGCPGSAHFTKWDNGTFLGTACEEHGGHKFAIGTQPALVTEPLAPVRTPCPRCPSGFLMLGVCPVCGYGVRQAKKRPFGHRGFRAKRR